MMEMFIYVPSTMVATRHIWLLSARNVAGVTK